MNRILATLMCCVLVMAFGVAAATAEKRVALVIGNSNYQNAPPLKNPLNDAEAVAKLLSRLGFDVVKGIDLTDRDFARTISTFAKRLDKGADAALFFYAGHGLQVKGKNYLVPVDAELASEASLDFETVRLQTILSLMERTRRTNLVFLDACRNNPMARNLARNMGTRSAAIGRGLARVETGVGTLIAYSTQPGNVALDGEGFHSPFAKALLKHTEQPGLEIEGLMRKVRQDVITETNGAQVPWNHSSLTRTFVFRPKAKTAAVSSPKPVPVTPALPTTPQFDTRALDLAFWTSIQNSSNIALFKEYLRQYPEGQFKVIANARIKTLTAQKAAKGAASTPEPARAAEPEKAPEPVKTARLQDEPAEPEAKTPDKRQLTLTLQRELKRVGCDPGVADGIWGRKGRLALSNFARYAKLNVPGSDPSEEIIDMVRSKKSRICPIVCRAGQELKNGRCVATQLAKAGTATPERSGSYDGTYQIRAKRTIVKNKIACLSSYKMTLVVRNGRATHKIPWGHTLSARARASRLYISSIREASGGGWSGALGLATRTGAKTSGYLKWTGDSSRKCEYRMIVVRTK
ncbi:MAG: hypothetical protein HKN11_11830 [Rhizobiales bacterium]|nr:hypothetical protein [Hyphomicrobiales bacterium]